MWSWLCTCIWNSLNASEPVADWQPGAHHACAEAHGALDFGKEGCRVGFGSRGISKIYCFLVIVPLICPGRPPSLWLPPLFWGSQAFSIHLATWSPTSFQRHPYLNFRQLWFPPTLLFINIQLIVRSHFLPEQNTGTVTWVNTPVLFVPLCQLCVTSSV